jgi:glycosyltransferase involved in cell wall biosynthesis
VASPPTITLDATYSAGANLTGVGIYSREMLEGLSRLHPVARFIHCFRPHAFRRARPSCGGSNVRRSIFGETWMLPPRRSDLFHGLNQRVPSMRFRRTVSTFHDLFVISSSEYSSPEFRARFTEQARNAASRSDLIICVSAFTASQVSELTGVERGRLRVVHHGVRSLQRVAASSEHRLPLVLCVGAIQHRKNTARLVRAFRAVPEPWRLVLAGAPDGYGAADALDQVRKTPRVEVLGYVSPEKLAELYATASVFAFPSLDEGFGMPVLEAMANGVPVLSSDRSALPEVCGDAAILVDPLREDAIAEGLLRLTGDEGVRADYCVRGRNRAAEFSWDRAVEQTWSVYEELGVRGGT